MCRLTLTNSIKNGNVLNESEELLFVAFNEPSATPKVGRQPGKSAGSHM